jgi:hypothetical protein
MEIRLMVLLLLVLPLLGGAVAADGCRKEGCWKEPRGCSARENPILSMCIAYTPWQAY